MAEGLPQLTDDLDDQNLTHYAAMLKEEMTRNVTNGYQPHARKLLADDFLVIARFSSAVKVMTECDRSVSARFCSHNLLSTFLPSQWYKDTAKSQRLIIMFRHKKDENLLVEKHLKRMREIEKMILEIPGYTDVCYMGPLGQQVAFSTRLCACHPSVPHLKSHDSDHHDAV